MKEEFIFTEALLIADKVGRQAYLRSACGDDQEMLNRVTALLQAKSESDSLLDRPIEIHENDSTVETVHQVGQQIENFKLLHLLGEGGMGSVFLAEQQEPVKRRVAVKIIKQGLNNKQFIARFEAEQQALAMMDHPNIAKVLDAGSTHQGQNFFVMELVKGTPITKFCDENQLNTEDRLKLFQQVIQAIRHAHQKGIIHRDLKPSNVLVAMYDDKPVPKVIDFGVAKATHQPLTKKTLCTIPGQIVGTWEYMSPEQAILNQLDVDTRTDIYSLGVILYELLTGHTPLDLKSLRPEQLEERLRRIREQEPSRPSIRASRTERSRSPKEAYAVSALQSLAKSRRTDLDWLVMKAIQKDRSDRYDSASKFLDEVERFLKNEPLSFRPPSTWHQFRKFCSRHKPLVASSAAILVALLIGFVFTYWSLVQQQKLVVELTTERERSLELVEKLEQENQDSQAAKSFLSSLISSANPQYHESRGPSYTVLEMLYDAEARLHELDSRPTVKAYCQSTLGYAFRTLAEPRKADRCLEQAYLNYKNHADFSTPEARLAMRRLGWHRRDPVLLKRLAQIEKELGVPDKERSHTIHHIAVALNASGQYSDAISWGLKTNRLNPDATSSVISIAFLNTGKVDRALDYLKMAIPIRTQVCGKNEMELAWSYLQQAKAYELNGDYDARRSSLQETLRILNLHRHGYSAYVAALDVLSAQHWGDVEYANEKSTVFAGHHDEPLIDQQEQRLVPWLERQRINTWIGLAEYYKLRGEKKLAQKFYRKAADRPISDGNLIEICYAESQLTDCRRQLVMERLKNFAPIKKDYIADKKVILEIHRNLDVASGDLGAAASNTIKILAIKKLGHLWRRDRELQLLIELAEHLPANAGVACFKHEMDRIKFASPSCIYRILVSLRMLDFKVKKGIATKSDWDNVEEKVTWFGSEACSAPDFSKSKVKSYFDEIQEVKSPTITRGVRTNPR